MGDLEMKYINEAFMTNWIAPLGPNVEAFEQEVADVVGVSHAHALASGTAAIHLALRVLNINAGDKVFCSTLTFVGSVNPILYQGAEPVFIDSDRETWNMSPAALERAFNEAQKEGNLPKAVIVVNLYGQSADMDKILPICNRFNVPVIEDAAESLGATYKNKHSGTLGRFGIFSFNGNKIISTSGGGMLVSDDTEGITKARFLSAQAREPEIFYQHNEVGYNYRLSNILAGIGRGQLRKLAERIDARRAVFERYINGLSNIKGIEFMPEASYGKSTRWLTALTVDPNHIKLTTTEIIRGLDQKNIESRPVWKPMHLQPLFKGCEYYSHKENESVSDFLFQHGLCLPSSSSLCIEEQNYVIDCIKELLKTT